MNLGWQYLLVFTHMTVESQPLHWNGRDLSTMVTIVLVVEGGGGQGRLDSVQKWGKPS